jgi:hypothetical protein
MSGPNRREGVTLSRRLSALAAAVTISLVASVAALSPVRAADPTWFSCGQGSGYLSSANDGQTVAQGQSAVFTIDIHRVGCPDPIDFFVDAAAPTGMTMTFGQAPTTADSITLTVTTSNKAPVVTPPGLYGLPIQVVTGHSFPGIYLVLGFTVTPSVAPVEVAPVSRLRVGTTIGPTTVPVRTSWAASDPDGIARYVVARQVNGGAWSTVTLASPTSASVTQSLRFGWTYRYRVRAVDRLGHSSAYVYGRPFRPSIVQQTSRAITSAWPWRTAWTSAASGGSLKYQPSSGADFTFTSSAASVGWVTVRGPTRTDSFAVWVDGKLKASDLRLTSPTTLYRRIGYVAEFWANGRHSITFESFGHIGRSRMDIDAFVLLTFV